MRIESTETLGGTSVTPEQQERMQAAAHAHELAMDDDGMPEQTG